MTTKPDFRVPDAKLILRSDAPRDEWLGMRTTGLGGSDMATLMGASTFAGATVYNLWVDKTAEGDRPELTGHQLRHGSDVEPILADWFIEDTGIAVRKAGMHKSKENDTWLANPDRLTADGGVLEIKTTSRFTPNGKTWIEGGIPQDAYVQSQWYLHVLGRSHVWLAAEVDNSHFIIKGPIERDEELIEAMKARAEWFWNDHVLTRTAPPVDPYLADASEIAARFPADVVEADATVEADFPDMAVDDYERLTTLKADASYIKEQIAEIETRVKASIGDREFLAANGRPLFRWQPIAGRKSFDKTAVLSKLAAERGVEPTKAALKQIEDEYTKTGAPTRRLTPIKQSGVAA